MKHREKMRMARKMLTKEERKKHTPIFQSKAWTKRAESIKTRVRNKIISWIKKPNPAN